ncbi:hypothetical protein GIB67_022435, partial [Kingdonia uniflora]
YKASDVESGNDASVLESRTSTQRERRKIKGFNKELSEGDKRLKRAKDSGSQRWLCSSVVRGKLDSTADSHSDTKEYGLSLPLTNLAKGIMNAIGACPVQLNGNMWEASGGSYFCMSATRRCFFDLNSAGRTWNDNIIWVKGNCLQRDDEELLDLWFRTVKQSVKSTVERKESVLDEVEEEEIELKLVLEGLGESGEKVTEGRSATVDDLKEVEERARLAVLLGEEDTSKMVAHLVKGIWLGIEEKKLKASHALAIGQLQVETKANLDKMVEEHDRLGRYLMLKGYSEEVVDAIKADTYAEEEDEEDAEAVGIVDGLDSVFVRRCSTIKGMTSSSRKAIRVMSLRINDLDSGLARKRETSKALLSAQAELQRCKELAKPSDILDPADKNDPNKLKKMKTCITFALSLVW